MFNGFENYNLKDRIKNFFVDLWENHRKIVVIVGSIIIVLFFLILSLTGNNKLKAEEISYKDIENKMMEGAKIYFNEKNMSLSIGKSYYLYANDVDVSIDYKLNCDENSGILIRNNSGSIEYVPYLICPNHKSEEITNMEQRNKVYSKYGTISGDNPLFLADDSYKDPGYKIDSKCTIKTTGATSLKAGYNLVRYNIFENNVFVANLERIVIVKRVEPEYPILELVGETTRTLLLGATYNETGYIADDKIDGDITNNVKTIGTVDTSKPGTYTIIYSVTNSNDLTTKKERTIIINKEETDLTISSKVVVGSSTAATIYLTISGSDYSKTTLPNKSTSNSNKITYAVGKNGTYDFIAYDKKGNAKVESVKVTGLSAGGSGISINKTTKPNTGDINSVDGSCTGTYDPINKILYLNVIASNSTNIKYYEFKSGAKTSGKITKSSFAFSGESSNGTVTLYDSKEQTKNMTCSITNSTSVGGIGGVNLSCAEIKEPYAIGGNVYQMKNFGSLCSGSSSTSKVKYSDFFNKSSKIYLANCTGCGLDDSATETSQPAFPGGSQKMGEMSFTNSKGVSMCVGRYIANDPINWQQYVSYTHWYEFGSWMVNRAFPIVVAQMIQIQTYATGRLHYDSSNGTMLMYADGCCAQTTRDPIRTIQKQQASGSGKNGEHRGQLTIYKKTSGGQRSDAVIFNKDSSGNAIVSKNYMEYIVDANMKGEDLYCKGGYYKDGIAEYTYSNRPGTTEQEKDQYKPCQITIQKKYEVLYYKYVQGKLLVQPDGTLMGRYDSSSAKHYYEALDHSAAYAKPKVSTIDPDSSMDSYLINTVFAALTDNYLDDDHTQYYYEGQRITNKCD